MARFFLVTVGIVVFTSITINASDIFRGIESNLSGLVAQSTDPCGEHAVLQHLATGAVCVDMYEASADDSCGIQNPLNEVDTGVNISDGSCAAASIPEAKPWRFVSMTQAQQLCARAGKRLLTSEEWYQTVLGMGDMSSCALAMDGAPLSTGVSNCVTPAGVHDMIGNVWEWVDGEVTDGVYGSVTLPPSGYVSLVDSGGNVLETATNPQSEFGDDYVWSESEGVRGMMRGGFYGSGSDAGIFTLNASVPLNFKTGGVGFRCAKDLY